MTPGVRTKIRHTALLATLVVSVVACGGSETISERPLTSDEAAILAAVQYENLQVGGASFEINAADTTTNTTMSMTGDIDWVNHRGRAQVTASGREEGLAAVTWDLTQVLERRLDIGPLLARLGHPTDAWVARGPDITNRTLDRVIAIITGMASKQPDNAILIQQKEGSAFVRDDTWKNTPVKVYRYGERNLFWLDATTNELRRFEGNNAPGNRPVIIDFLERAPRSVELPAPKNIVPVSALQELYKTNAAP